MYPMYFDHNNPPPLILPYFKPLYLRPLSPINNANMCMYEVSGLNPTFVLIQTATFVEEELDILWLILVSLRSSKVSNYIKS